MTATVATNSLTCTISGVIVGGIELPFNGCPKNACEHMSEGAITIILSILYTISADMEIFKYPQYAKYFSSLF